MYVLWSHASDLSTNNSAAAWISPNGTLSNSTNGTWMNTKATWNNTNGTWSDAYGTWVNANGNWSYPSGNLSGSTGLNGSYPVCYGLPPIANSTTNGTWINTSGNWSDTNGTWVNASGTWNNTFGTWVNASGTWSNTNGTWVNASGTWINTNGQDSTDAPLPPPYSPLSQYGDSTSVLATLFRVFDRTAASLVSQNSTISAVGSYLSQAFSVATYLSDPPGFAGKILSLGNTSVSKIPHFCNHQRRFGT